jgi:flagellar protein FliL
MVNGVDKSKPGREKNKIFLVVYLLFIHLCLGGMGVFIFMKMDNKTTSVDNSKEQPLIKKTSGELFQFKPFVVNLPDKNARRFLKATIAIELGKGNSIAKIEKNKIKLRHSVVMLLTTHSLEDVMTPEGKNQLIEELRHNLNQITKPDRIVNVYFPDFVVQ